MAAATAHFADRTTLKRNPRPLAHCGAGRVCTSRTTRQDETIVAPRSSASAYRGIDRHAARTRRIAVRDRCPRPRPPASTRRLPCRGRVLGIDNFPACVHGGIESFRSGAEWIPLSKGRTILDRVAAGAKLMGWTAPRFDNGLNEP